MAMDFMALRARLAINLAVLILLMVSCDERACIIKLKSYSMDKVHLKNLNGVWYNGQTPFSGIVYALTAQGDSIFSRSYVEGMEDGMHKGWYPNGNVQELRFYTSGKKTGINKGYWPDGRKRYLYQFDNDLYEGTQYEWYSNGKLYSKKNYHLGYERGLQQSWNPDGTVKSNYEARNGRNYGNIGKKNCYSAWKDSVYVSAR